MEKIDNLDRKILNIVMRNARIASKDVALECGVSRAAIHQRIQRLIEMNVITGSGYTVDPKILGYNTCTYVGVKLEKGSMYRDVVAELENIKEVVSKTSFDIWFSEDDTKLYSFKNDIATITVAQEVFKKHLEEYYKKVCDDYTEMLQTLTDMEEAFNQNLVSDTQTLLLYSFYRGAVRFLFCSSEQLFQPQ